MDGVKNKKEKYTPITLPHEIIENILSRIPVKYLHRFKSVSKQWKATISDPRFAEIHLQQYRNSSSRNLLAWEETYDYGGFYVTKLQIHKFRFVSAIEYPWEESLEQYDILCYCDGLYLKWCGTHEDKSNKTYLLWICYDPLMKDYKVVIADMKHYAVFFCRNNKWSKKKYMKDFSRSDESYGKGISFNGSCYWIVKTGRVEEVVEFEIICFNWRDEKFKKLSKPDCRVEADDLFSLTSCGGHLCLLVVNDLCNEIRIMKKVEGDDEDSWI